MKHVTIDCTLMVDEKSVHDQFSHALEFPSYYGRNLDALYDLLSTSSALELKLVNARAIGELFRYGDNLMLALRDAEQANPLFTLIVED